MYTQFHAYAHQRLRSLITEFLFRYHTEITGSHSGTLLVPETVDKSHICSSVNVTHKKKLKTTPGKKQVGDDFTIIKIGTGSNYKNSLSAKKMDSSFNTTVLQALCGSPC